MKHIDMKGRRGDASRQPKRCSICTEPATMAIVEHRPAVAIGPVGVKRRFVEATMTYYCERHLP